jgi:DNA-binding transcriptional MocR family regulator
VAAAGDRRGIAAGLNVVLTLPDGNDERAVVARAVVARAVVARAAEREVGVYPCRWFTADPGGARPGLVLGYGTVTPEQAAWGMRVLGEVVAGG